LSYNAAISLNCSLRMLEFLINEKMCLRIYKSLTTGCGFSMNLNTFNDPNSFDTRRRAWLTVLMGVWSSILSVSRLIPYKSSNLVSPTSH
jgi:hypothetical protein